MLFIVIYIYVSLALCVFQAAHLRFPDERLERTPAGAAGRPARGEGEPTVAQGGGGGQAVVTVVEHR